MEISYKYVLVGLLISGLVSLGIFCSIFNRYCVKCYECNVWKAGYGHLCAEPRIRNDCMYCMKLDTQMWTGYYKDTPRYANTTTRICANDITPHFSDECHRYTTVDGTSTRCYCDTDLCNTAGRTVTPSRVGLIVAAAVIYKLIGQFH